MALQLTGAAKPDSIANLQIRLPVVVIGGGLTAIDTATEALAYYPLQVEKFLARYEALAVERSAAQVRALWSEAETAIADEFIDHARQIRAEREAAAREGRPPNLSALVNRWGGVTVAYRRRMVEAPSYTLNHEEIAKAMEEGIRFAERLLPTEVVLDAFGRAKALKLARQGDVPGEAEVTLPARTIVVAAGTQPNTTLAREDPAMVLDGKYYRARSEDGETVTPERIAKPATAHVLTSVRADGRAVSFFGDLHPSFAGNVVKAMASAKQGYPVVSRLLSKVDTPPVRRAYLFDQLDRELRPRHPSGQPPHPDHRRGGGARAHGGARLPTRAVLSPAELRELRNPRGRHLPRHGRPGADRRVGRPRAGAARHHRAGDGRLVRSLRHAAARRARDPDGSRPARRPRSSRARPCC